MTTLMEYIYSFPIQQIIVSFLPNLTPWQHFAVSLVFVIPLAAVSWHSLEKPALKLKKYLPLLNPVGTKILVPSRPLKNLSPSSLGLPMTPSV